MINILSNARVILFGAALFGYGLVGILIDDPISSQLLTIPYRILVLLLSMFVILSSLLNLSHLNSRNLDFLRHKLINQLPVYTIAIFAFVLIYSFRMIYELIYNQNLVLEKSQYSLYWFLISLLTGISFLFFDTNAPKKYLYFSWAVLLFVVASSFFKSSQLESSSFGEQNRLGSEGLNPISLGHYASSLIIISMYAFFNLKHNYKKNTSRVLFIFFCGASFSIGMLILFKANSRGPFLATMVSLFLMFIANFSKIKDDIIILSPLFVIGVCNLVVNTIEDPNAIFGRLIGIENEFGNSKDVLRPEMYETAISLITNNLATGFGLELPGFGYPHNIIVESFLTTGIIGGLLFVFIYINSIVISLSIIFNQKNGWSWLSFLYIQEAIGSLFSGCIYKSPNFWYLLFSISVVSFTSHESKK
jgi:O-antigen ligase